MRFRKKSNKVGRSPFTYKKVKVKTNVQLFFGTSGLATTNQQVVEGFMFLKLKLKIRKSIKRKKKQFRIKNSRFSYWVRYNPNTFFLKKSKNARMGSGRGKPVRRASTNKASQSLVEFKVFRVRWLASFSYFFFTKYSISLFLVNRTKTNCKLFRQRFIASAY